MLYRLLYMAGYALYWLLFFLFFKGAFLIYQHAQTTQLSPEEIALIFWHGLPMDLSFTAYSVAIPYLLITVDTVLASKGRWLKPVMLFYSAFLIFALTLIGTTDLELYQAWGFRLDDTPLNYINTPKEMLASVGSSPIWLLIIFNIVVNLFFSEFYRRTLHRQLPWPQPSYRIAGLPLLLLTASLVIVMRGGFQTIPLNQSTVFFSNSYFANQAALNVAWNFAHALGKRRSKDDNPYRFVAEQEARRTLDQLYPEPDLKLPDSARWLNTRRPNIILIIWESFTAKLAEPLGGYPGVTPNFNRLTEEGLLFTNTVASGDRSDKGLVAILSGYPAQPNATIIKEPNKSRSLPQLASTLKPEGYYNSFYYGGELDFANLRTFLRFGKWDKLVSDDSFREEDRNSKWGAHDGVVARRFKDDLNTFPQPFFSTWFTLSSHEPFEIPMNYKFGQDNETELFLSSHYYTDSVIGEFIKHAKQQEWWQNSLVVIVADHGHRLPDNSQAYEKSKFSIPMLWLGGALERKGRWPHTTSQTDLAAMLLSEFDLSSSEYRWSKDYRRGHRSFAQYVFKSGWGLVTDTAFISEETIGRTILADSGNNRSLLPLGRAHLQQSYLDYLNR